jgi:hypothetical protein
MIFSRKQNRAVGILGMSKKVSSPAPSADTILRVLGRIGRRKFEGCFLPDTGVFPGTGGPGGFTGDNAQFHPAGTGGEIPQTELNRKRLYASYEPDFPLNRGFPKTEFLGQAQYFAQFIMRLPCCIKPVMLITLHLISTIL